jgi:hypothetical protein
VPTVRGTIAEISLNKRNYRQAKRQKEDARKTRQQQKQQRRADREATVGITLIIEPTADGEPVTPAPAPEPEGV